MRSACALLIFALALGSAPTARAVDIAWDGGGGSADWSDPLNWDGDTLPNDSDFVEIGNLPAAAGATVLLSDNSFARRIELSGGATLDTGAGRLHTLGNLVARDESSALLVRRFDTPALNPSLDAYNVTLRGGTEMLIDDAWVQILTPGQGLASFGVVTVEPGATLSSTGGLVRFLDGLEGGAATQLVNDGVIRVVRPDGFVDGVTYTLKVDSNDPGATADLDGDAGAGAIDLGDYSQLHVTTASLPFGGTADLSTNARLRFDRAVTFADGAVVNFDGGAASHNRVTTDVSIAVESGATLNLNSGNVLFSGGLTAAAGSQFNVADGAQLHFAFGDAAVSGGLDLGSGSSLRIGHGTTTLDAPTLDWDGGEDVLTDINNGGNLVILADDIETTNGDNTYNGQIEVLGGATPADASSLRTTVTQGWALAGTMLIRGSADGTTGAASFINGPTPFSIAPGGVVELDSGVIESESGGTIVNDGTVMGSGLIGGSAFTNNGLLRAVAGSGDGVLRTNTTQNVDLDGSDQVNPGAVEAVDGDIDVQGRLSDNFGGVATVGSGRTIDFRLGWILGGPATLNLNGGAEPATVDSSGINVGEPNEQNGATVLRGTVNVVNTGRLLGDTEVRSSATINVTDNFGNLEFGGETQIQTGVEFLEDGQTVNLSGGVMTTEDGVDFGPVTLINDGLLRVEGDLAGSAFIQDNNGETVLGLGGVLESEYDQLVFDAIASLGGELSVEFTDGFVAGDGDSFLLLTSPAGPARFDQFNAPELAEGLSWRLDYTETGVLASVGADVTIVLPGDYNEDGVVDAADYTVWRDSVGSTVDLAADGNDNGVVDAEDYGVWSDNYGATAAVSASVPEPAAALLALAGLVAWGSAAAGARRQERQAR